MRSKLGVNKVHGRKLGDWTPNFFPCKTGPQRNDFHYQFYICHTWTMASSFLTLHRTSPPMKEFHSQFWICFMVPIPLYFSEGSCCKFPKWFADLQATLMLETSNQEIIGLLNVQKQITNMRKNKRLLDCMKSRETWSSCLPTCLSFFYLLHILPLDIWIGLVGILNSWWFPILMVTFVEEKAPPRPLVIAAVFLSQNSRCTIGIVMKTCYAKGTTTAAQR